MHGDAHEHPAKRPDHLTDAELHRLTLYKWRYTFESFGFAPPQVDELLFLTWLRATSRVRG
jgi:hypothetical protein